MISTSRRIAAIEQHLSASDKDQCDPQLLRVMQELADRVREAAMNPAPGMEDVARAYAAVLLPLPGEAPPFYQDGWKPGERYWREVARIIGYTGLPTSAKVSAGISS